MSKILTEAGIMSMQNMLCHLVQNTKWSRTQFHCVKFGTCKIGQCGFSCLFYQMYTVYYCINIRRNEVTKNWVTKMDRMSFSTAARFCENSLSFILYKYSEKRSHKKPSHKNGVTKRTGWVFLQSARFLVRTVKIYCRLFYIINA